MEKLVRTVRTDNPLVFEECLPEDSPSTSLNQRNNIINRFKNVFRFEGETMEFVASKFWSVVPYSLFIPCRDVEYVVAGPNTSYLK